MHQSLRSLRDLMAKEVEIEDPEIRKLVESLKNLPEYLAKRSQRIKERREFCKKVFQKAIVDAFGEEKPKLY